MLAAQSTRRREERSYNNNSYLEKWIGKVLLLLGRTLIRIEPIAEILKELESSPAKLKSKFR